eukprot:4493478-Amphidinium_carterae.1
MLMSAVISCHLVMFSLAASADGLVVSVETEEPGRVFSSLHDRKELAFVGGLIVAPIGGNEPTEGEGGVSITGNLDHRPAGSAKFFPGWIRGTAISEEEPWGREAPGSKSEGRLSRYRALYEVTRHSECRKLVTPYVSDEVG